MQMKFLTGLPIVALIALVSLTSLDGCTKRKYACTTDADCTKWSGSRCDQEIKMCQFPDGGPIEPPGDLTVKVTVPPNSRTLLTGTEWGEASDGTAYVRGDKIAVQVEVSGGPVDASSVKYTVQGVKADGQASPASAATLVKAGTCAQGSSAKFCGSFDVETAAPILDALRGDFALAVVAGGEGSSHGSGTAAVPVTRWRWKRASFTSLAGTPAIDGTGVLYVVGSGLAGGLWGIGPDGAEQWKSTTVVSKVISSPVLGANTLYIADAQETVPSSIRAISLTTHEDVHSCKSDADSPTKGAFEAALALTSTGGIETIVGVVNDDFNVATMVTERPMAGSNKCLRTALATRVTFPGSIIVENAQAFLGDADGRVKTFTYVDDASPRWDSNLVWSGTGATAIQGAAAKRISALALAPVGVVGTVESQGAFALKRTDGTVIAGYRPGGSVGTKPGSAVIGQGNVTYFGTSTSQLFRVTFDSAAQVNQPSAGPISAAPAIGSDQVIYTLAESGQLELWTSTLDKKWSVALGSGFKASPTLDCHRTAGAVDFGPGTLYAAATDGTLYAIVVDSHGLDHAAPWPKYQHDARNTGNSSTAWDACP